MAEEVFGWFKLEQSSEAQTVRLRRLSIAFAITTIIFVVMFIAVFVLVRHDKEDNVDMMARLGGQEKNAASVSTWTGLEKNASASMESFGRLETNASGILARLGELERNASNILTRLKETEKNASGVLARLEILEKNKEQSLNNTKNLIDKIWATWYKATDGTLYKRFNQAMNYESAGKRCSDFNGVLLSKGLRNTVILGELMDADVLIFGYQGWIGYNDIVEEDGWVWADGGATNTTVVQWRANQPDNWSSGEDCAQMGTIYASHVVINDRPCRDRRAFICEA